MAMPGAGSQNPGFSTEDTQYHSFNAGQPYVYSGYWGKPVYGNQLPDYEKAAYGFPSGGGMGQPGGSYQKDLEAYQAGYSHTAPNPNDPKYQSGGSGPGGFSQTSGYQQQIGGGVNTDYQRAATNAVQAMYNRLRSRSQEELFTLGAKTGTFSSGVNKERVAGRMGELDLNEAADIARIWQQNSGGSSSSGSMSGGVNNTTMGPWNMGGGGMALPGFLPQPGAYDPNAQNDGSRPGSLVGADGGYKKPNTAFGGWGGGTL